LVGRSHCHPGCSYGGPSWINIGLNLWVVSGGIIELTIVVLGVEVGSDGVGDSYEVVEEDAVAEVGVKVILEMLEHVHVLLNESVSSNSWEGEGTVIKLPGMDLEFWDKVLLLLESLEEVLNVSPVSQVEGSGEHIDLILEFIVGLIEIDAVIGELNVGSILNKGLGSSEGQFVTLGGLEIEEALLSGNGSYEKKGKGGVFHLYDSKFKLISRDQLIRRGGKAKNAIFYLL